jgi:hypothetical protein
LDISNDNYSFNPNGCFQVFEYIKDMIFNIVKIIVVLFILTGALAVWVKYGLQ